MPEDRSCMLAQDCGHQGSQGMGIYIHLLRNSLAIWRQEDNTLCFRQEDRNSHTFQWLFKGTPQQQDHRQHSSKKGYLANQKVLLQVHCTTCDLEHKDSKVPLCLTRADYKGQHCVRPLYSLPQNTNTSHKAQLWHCYPCKEPFTYIPSFPT